MKKMALLLAILVTVQGSPASVKCETQAIRLDNPHFDGNLSGWEQQVFPKDNKNVEFQVVQDGLDGSKSARIASKGRGGGSLVQTLRIEGYSSIRVTGHVKGAISEGLAFIDCAMVSDNVLKPPFPRCEPALDSTSEWTKVSGVFSVPMGTKAIRISLTVAGDGHALFDSIEVTGEKGNPAFQGTVEIEENLVPDPGFEETSSGSFARWTKIDGTGKLSVSTEAHDGSSCARIDSDSDKPLKVKSDVSLGNHAPPFGIVGFIKTRGSAKAYVTVEFQSGKGGGRGQKPVMILQKTTPDSFDNNDWNRVQCVFSLPSEVKAFSVVCVVEGAGTVWFDDVLTGTLKKPGNNAQTGEYDEFWVENPVSKIKLATHVFKPDGFDEGKRYPVVFLLPGGNGYGTQTEKTGLPARLSRELGCLVTVFDPDGRGLTKDGSDDLSGEIHQAGFNAVVKHVSTLPYVDETNLGFYTMSFGIILGACTAGRYPDNPPVKYILDWEGPDGHLCPTNHIGRYDIEFWASREASDWIRKFPGVYIRFQSEKDHVQKTNDHALRMINAATNKAYGGEGMSILSRVNMQEGEFSNPSNLVYRDGLIPVWFGESQDRRMDEHVVRTLKELIKMKPSFEEPRTQPVAAVRGRNRMGFLNAYGYPRYSKDSAKKYFDALGVEDSEAFEARIASEMEPLNPTVARVDFFMWAGDEWRQRFAGFRPNRMEEIRFLGTLIFRSPGDPVEIGKKVSLVVELYDGDGDGDNPYGVVIKDWQIENEINMGSAYWKGTPQEYAKHLEVCAKAAKTADPECKIVLAGEACDATSDVYPKMLAALDHKQVFDAVDIHVYSDSRQRSAVSDFAQRFAGYLKSAGFENNIPMWMSEYGVTTGKARNAAVNDENVQASTLAIRTIQAAALSFEGSCYISLVDLYPDQANKDYFDRMGLISSGLASREKAWAKRKSYRAYQRLSELMSMVSFANVLKVAPFGESITSYKFSRPGLEPLIFAYIDKPDRQPKDKPNLFTQPFTYYQIIPGDAPESSEWEDGVTVLPGDREKSARFVEDLLRGPLAIVMGDSSSIASRIGISDAVLETCLDQTACSPYYAGGALSGLGTSWMLMRPRLDFLTNPKGWGSNDSVLYDMAQNGVEPVIDFSAFPGIDAQRLGKAGKMIAERYDGDGLGDALGDMTATRFRLEPSQGQTSQEFAQVILEFGKSIKTANKNSVLVIGGDKAYQWWAETFSKLASSSDKNRRPFDIFDVPGFQSVALDPEKNHKALLIEIARYRKLLDETGLALAGISTMKLGTHSGQLEGKPSQTESDQATELVKLYTISSSARSSLIGLDARLPLEFQLYNADGSPRIAWHTLSRLSQGLSLVRNSGRLVPGDEDFGARFFDRTTDGLWISRFGLGSNSMAIGWIDADKPPMFSSQDYGLPFSTAIELEYLVPELPVKGIPVFKKLIIGGQYGRFTIPTDRLDPFVIRPTGETLEPLTVTLNPPELKLDPGQQGTVKVRVAGCTGKTTLSFPSTRTLPIESVSTPPGENGEFFLKVSTDSSNKGKTVTVKITAICDNGQQSSAELTVTVSSQSTTNITLWVGKNTALINGREASLAVPPTIIDGKTLVPVRFISEAFGAKVVWDQKEQRIDLIFGLLDDNSYTKKVTLWIGKKTAQADFGSKLPAFREYTLDVAPAIISGTTMVPIRFLSDVLGAKTLWDGAEKRIDITWTPF